MGLEPSTRLAEVLDKKVMFQRCHLFEPTELPVACLQSKPPITTWA